VAEKDQKFVFSSFKNTEAIFEEFACNEALHPLQSDVGIMSGRTTGLIEQFWSKLVKKRHKKLDRLN